MTTLDNTVLSDRTTATAVSSAEDSNAANFSENVKSTRKVSVSAANVWRKQKYTIPRTVNDLRDMGFQAKTDIRLI